MLKIDVRLLRLVPVLVATLLPALPAAASPDVVASLKPLHSVVAAVMEGVGDPQLLIDGAASPHSFELRPSQARALQDADLLVLAGAGLEPFGERLDGSGAPQVIRMSDLAGIRLRPLGGQGASDGEHGGEEHEEHGGEEGIDPHLWLDPTNMVRLADEVANALEELDPTHGERYRANAALIGKTLHALDRWIGQQLEPLKGRPFLVGHDAYGYFVARYGLRQIGVAALTPEQLPGARTLRALRDRVADLAPVCVFQEPDMAPAVLQTLAEGVEVEFGELDPHGAALPPGPDHYPTLLRKLTANFAACLERLPPRPG